MRRSAFLLMVVALVTVSCPVWSETPSGDAPQDKTAGVVQGRRITIGTFNIKMFPCGDDCACIRREGLSFRCKREGGRATDWSRLAETIRAVSPDILAVNEILNPERLQRFAREHLGKSWEFVYAREGGSQKVGFLYNTDMVKLKSRKSYPELYEQIDAAKYGTCLKSAANLRPALACRFGIRHTTHDVTLVVVHLKSANCHVVRLDQWRILEGITDRLLNTDKEVLIVGDFNDRGGAESEYAAFCEAKRFHCVTRSVGCSFLFSGQGRGALDGILASESVMRLFIEGSTSVGGPCAAGCKRTPASEAFRSIVSDHCPVVAQFRVP